MRSGGKGLPGLLLQILEEKPKFAPDKIVRTGHNPGVRVRIKDQGSQRM
jgi:hypothetical protein